MYRVLLFAELAEAAGSRVLEVEEREPLTVETLKQAIADQMGDRRFTELMNRCVVAVNQRYALPETVVRTEDEIALIPPVSGG